MNETYFQKGFGLKSEVGPVLARTYQSAAIERLKGLGYEAGAGGLHFKLAKEFGFCYGVDRAVDYAYQTRRQFPDRRVFLSGEIIHNPDVNRRIEAMGIQILEDSRDPVERFKQVSSGDVVILPAFGVSVPELAAPQVEAVRARRHDLRQRAERLEESPLLRARRLHRDHPRQALSRGNARDGVAGADPHGRPVSVRARRRRDRAGVRFHSRHDHRPPS